MTTAVMLSTRSGSSYINRSVIGCVPAPGSCLPGAGYVGVSISNVNRSVTGYTVCVPASSSGLRDPRVCWIGNPNLGRFGLAPLRGPESACLSRIAHVCLCSDGSRDESVYPSASGPAPVQTHKAGETPPRFPRFRHQPGQPRSPPGYLPCQTALRSSSGFCSSNLCSAPHRYPGMKIPSHRHQIVAVTGAENKTNCIFITILLQHSHQPVADYIPE